MTPQARHYLARAKNQLAESDAMLGLEFVDASGRSSYMAAFKAAQALIFERVGKAAKTHRGVHSEFVRLTRADTRLADELRPFLSRGYRLKTNADYELDSGVTVALVIEANTMAKRFVAAVETILTDPAET